MNTLDRLAAFLIKTSTLVDRAFHRFDRLRSRTVLATGSEGLLEAYNDLAYGRTPEYRADLPKFRRELFRWEQDAVARWFPAPPATILVGGAGGGREALALAERGYRVIAFEPAAALARSLAGAPASTPIEVFLGRYETLPVVSSLDGGNAIRLDERAPCDAAIVGWASYSHLRTEARRVQTLQNMAAVCRGPILLSFYPAKHQPRRDLFSVAVGFYHLSDEAEIRGTAASAGLDVLELSMEDLDGRWPFAVLQRRSAPGR